MSFTVSYFVVFVTSISIMFISQFTNKKNRVSRVHLVGLKQPILIDQIDENIFSTKSRSETTFTYQFFISDPMVALRSAESTIWVVLAPSVVMDFGTFFAAAATGSRSQVVWQRGSCFGIVAPSPPTSPPPCRRRTAPPSRSRAHSIESRKSFSDEIWILVAYRFSSMG